MNEQDPRWMDRPRNVDEQGVSPIEPAHSPSRALFSPSPAPAQAGVDEKPHIAQQQTWSEKHGTNHPQGEYDEYLVGYGNGFENDPTRSQYAGSSQPFFPQTPEDGRWDGRVHRHDIEKVIHWWWWWEIGAAATSVIATAMVVVVLMTVNNKPLNAWTMPIQPNSLIAVITTVGKAAMMVTVTNCISQLKWRHFRNGAYPLSHLQSFDDASRGPWGAFRFFAQVNLQALLVCGFAVVTLIGMGIEPTTQQLIEFPSRLSTIENVNAGIGQARSYESKAYALLRQGNQPSDLSDSLFHPGTLPLESSLINGVIGAPSRPEVNCPAPAVQCSYPDFSTMGYCYSYSNLTDVAKAECTWGRNGTDPNNATCIYDYPNREPADPTPTMRWILRNTTANVVVPFVWTFLSSMGGEPQDSIGGAQFALATARMTDNGRWRSDFHPPLVELLYSRWYLCEQTFRGVSSVLGTLHIENTTTEPLTPVRNETRQPDSEKNNTNSIPDYTLLTYRSNATGREYTVKQRAPMQLSNYLGYMLTNTYAIDPTSSSPGFVGKVVLGSNNLLPLGYFLNSTDLRKTSADIAATLSAQMQSTSPGDNANLTLVPGIAQMPETYVSVRWEWILLPVVECLATVLLLAATIYQTWKEPLYKTSIIAPLVHGLIGWTPQEEARLTSLGTAEALQAESEGMITRFAQDPSGKVGFVKAVP